MSKLAFAGNIASSVGASALSEATDKLCKALATGDTAKVAAVFAMLPGGQAVAISLLIGGFGLQWWHAKRQQKLDKAQCKELHDKLTAFKKQLDAVEDDVTGLTDMLLPFVERKDFFLARLPGYEKADLAKMVAEAVKEELAPLLPEGTDRINWEDVALFLNRNNELLDALDDLIRAEHAKTRAHTTTEHEETRALIRGRASLPTIPEGVRDNLAQAGVRDNPDFVGRVKLLAEVHAALTAEGQGLALTHALSAEGGVGKTEVAVEYVCNEKYAKDWDGIWWLDASAIGIEQSLIRVLGVMGFADGDKLDPEERRSEFVRRLGEGHHLVVLDNLDDRATLSGLTVPTASRVLATTRLSKERLPPALANTINVEVFAPEDSARLLVKHRNDLRDEESGLPLTQHAGTIATIARELDQHALAVALTAAALRVDDGVTPVALLEQLRAAEIGAKEHPFTEMEADETGRAYGLKVYTSLLLHLDDLERKHPLVSLVLLLASLCHAEGIPFTMLAACMKAEEAEVRAVVRALAERSIVRFDGGVGVDKRGLLHLHRLTQSAVRHRAGEEAVEAAAEAVVVALNGVLTNCAAPEHWAVQSEALPHARAVLSIRPEDMATRSRLLNQSALLHNALGRATEAETLFIEALAMHRRLFEGNHPDIAGSLNNLAFVREALGRAAEAEPLYVEALAMIRRLFKGDHPNTATSLNNLASVRESLGRAAEAEPIFLQAFAMRRRLFEDDHPDIAQSLNNLAFVRQTLGRTAEAEPLYEQALAMRWRLFEGDHPDIARTLNNLASVRESLGRAAEAEPIYEQALAMYNNLFEGDHPDIATSMNNLAGVRESLGHPDEAEPLYEDAIAMRQRLYEGDHPDMALYLNNLAVCRGNLGKWDEALGPSEQAVAMAARCLPEGHPRRMLYEENLAFIRAKLGKG